MVTSSPLRIALPEGGGVSALLDAPPNPRAGFVFAHGAGAGMAHPFMTAIVQLLLERGVACLRYQFPYMEQRAKRPDRPPIAHATVRAAVDEAARQLRGVPLVAGGKSFGGRMTSQAQALEPLAGVVGLAFLGFPLHPPGKPADARAAHLADVHIPMLFLQGERDELADLGLLRAVVARLASRATLESFPAADHSFHVSARAGGRDAQMRADLCDRFVAWIDRIA